MTWIPDYPGSKAGAIDSEGKSETIEIYYSPALDEPVSEEISALTTTLYSRGIKIVTNERSTADPNLYVGIGGGVPSRMLTDLLSRLSRSMGVLSQRSNPLWMYVYDLRQPGAVFRLHDELQNALDHFAGRDEE